MLDINPPTLYLCRKYIEAMLATYIEKEGVQVKLVTIQYASDVFPHDNVATRWDT